MKRTIHLVNLGKDIYVMGSDVSFIKDDSNIDSLIGTYTNDDSDGMIFTVHGGGDDKLRRYDMIRNKGALTFGTTLGISMNPEGTIDYRYSIVGS